jgi:hypothetical protein
MRLSSTSDKESRNNLAILIGKIGIVVSIILGYAKEIDLPITIFLVVCFILLTIDGKPIEKEVTKEVVKKPITNERMAFDDRVW